MTAPDPVSITLHQKPPIRILCNTSNHLVRYYMVRPRTPICTNRDVIRDELFTELNTPPKEKPRHPDKNIYAYHPECPYANKNTGTVLESHYIYWRFYPKDIIHPNETVGHHNNDRTDNRVENLYKKEKMKKPDAPVPPHMTKLSEAPDRTRDERKYRFQI
jgi:hypothetical protein